MATRGRKGGFKFIEDDSGYRKDQPIIKDNCTVPNSSKDLTREGIEPNPGPTTTVSFGELFTDGILSILSYLTLSELNFVSHINRTFLDLVQSDRMKMDFSFHPSSSESSIDPIPRECNSLSRSVTRLITSNDLTFSLLLPSLHRLAQVFPRLMELQIDMMRSDPDTKLVSSDECANSGFHQPNIGTLTIEYPIGLRILELNISVIEMNCDSFLHGLSACPLLTSFTYNGYLTGDTPLSSLFFLPLVTVEIGSFDQQISSAHARDLLKAIQTTIVEIGMDATIEPQDLNGIRMTNLQRFSLDIFFTKSGDLGFLLSAAPNLIKFHPDKLFLPDLPFLSL